MCHIPTGKQVINRRDYYNLINGVILRQGKPFRVVDVVSVVKANLVESPYAANNKNLDIDGKVTDYLDTYRRYNFFKVEKGIYTPAVMR